MGKLICQAVILQLVVTEIDEHGRPIDEHTAPAVKVFRAKVRDVWAEVDKTVAQLEQTRRAQLQADAAAAAAAPGPRLVPGKNGKNGRRHAAARV